ncbi:MAG TPA: hypothetical protein VNZ86_11410, partial [Bacteroidia bacterium]|nr:hypothetical protein [Bacteroidia bacterium]
LSADTLSRVEQDAMGKRARQKLDDYYNYQEIINDPQYDTALRNHARSLAKDMLVSDMSVQPQNNPNTVSNPGSSSGTYAVHVTDCNGCSSTTVSGLIFSEKDSTYSGILPGIDKRADLVSGNPPTGFVVRKVSKRFGNKRVRVWEVFLR